MRYQTSKFLDDFLNNNNITIADLSKKILVSRAYISYVKNGTKTASEKFLLKMVEKFPQLKKKEKELLLMLENDKKIEKLKKLEKKRRETIGKDENLENFSKMTKREKVQYEKFLEGANFYFNDENVSEEEKYKLIASLNNTFFKALEKKQERKAKREKEKK